MATSEDINPFFAAVNAPAPPAAKEPRRKSMNLSMLAKAQEEDSSDQSVTGKRSPPLLRPSRPSHPNTLALRACVHAQQVEAQLTALAVVASLLPHYCHSSASLLPHCCLTAATLLPHCLW